MEERYVGGGLKRIGAGWCGLLRFDGADWSGLPRDLPPRKNGIGWADMGTNWVHALSECLAAIEREQIGSACPVVDHEVIRSADGGPDDMTVWLICRNKAEQRQFADTEFTRAISALRKKMMAVGFPESAVASVAVKVTSREDVNAKGYSGLR